MGATTGWEPDSPFRVDLSGGPKPRSFELSGDHHVLLGQIYSASFDFWQLYTAAGMEADASMRLNRPGFFGGWRKPVPIPAWQLGRSDVLPDLLVRIETGQLFIGRYHNGDGVYVVCEPLRDYIVQHGWSPDRLERLLAVIREHVDQL